MTVSELFNVLSGTSKHATSVRILSCGAEVVNTIFAKLEPYEKNIKVRAARYDEKRNVLTVVITAAECARYIDALKGVQK